MDYANDLIVAYPYTTADPSNAAKINDILYGLARPNIMFQEGGEAGLRDIGDVMTFVRAEQPNGAADFAKGVGYAATKSNGPAHLPGLLNAGGWKNDAFGGIRGGGTGVKGFILEGKIIGRCADEFYAVADAAGKQQVIKLSKLDQKYENIPLLDDEGNVVDFVEAQVDLEGRLGSTVKTIFIDGKSASTIGAAEYYQMERYAALAKNKNGEVAWMLEGQPAANFYAHVQDMMVRYDVRIHLVDADTGAPLMHVV